MIAVSCNGRRAYSSPPRRASLDAVLALTWILRELLSEVGDFFMGGRPVRVACIAVEQQCAGFQRFFEFFLAECNCLVVVVGTNDFEINAVAHEPPDGRAARARFLYLRKLFRVEKPAAEFSRRSGVAAESRILSYRDPESKPCAAPRQGGLLRCY
jgi:hypothetical protein